MGYMEGYLIPPLKMLQASKSAAPWKNIVLVPSCNDWRAPAALLQLLGLLSSRSERPLYDCATKKSVSLVITAPDDQRFEIPELKCDDKARCAGALVDRFFFNISCGCWKPLRIQVDLNNIIFCRKSMKSDLMTTALNHFLKTVRMVT